MHGLLISIHHAWWCCCYVDIIYQLLQKNRQNVCKTTARDNTDLESKIQENP